MFQNSNACHKNCTAWYVKKSSIIQTVAIFHQKQPPYLLHRMFKTYVLTNNIKVNTTQFLSMGLMKLATKNHGAGHLPPRRFIFIWPLLTRSFLLIPHCSFLWFHAILRIMEQHTIYKCYYSYKCWICAELCEAFIFLMENIYTYMCNLKAWFINK